MALLQRLISNKSTATSLILNPASRFLRCLSDDSFQRLNIYKDEEKCPKELDDDQYPKWLWTLLESKPSKEELYRNAQRLYTAGGYDAVFDGMPEKELVRLFRLSARARIQANNSDRRGGKVM